VTSNINKLDTRFKVLGSPLELVKDAYVQLVRDGTQEDLEMLLQVRGLKKSEIAGYRITATPAGGAGEI
jgi:hypothetical protein